MRSVAETAGWMPSSLKWSRFRGLLTRAMIRSQRYFSLATWQMSRLSSSSPVTATTRSARWMPARSSTHSSVASPYWTACSSSCSTVRYRRRSCSITVTSSPRSSSSRARFQPTLPAPAMITYSPAISGSSVDPRRSWAVAGAGWQGRRPAGIPLGFHGSRTQPGRDQRPIQGRWGSTEGPLRQRRLLQLLDRDLGRADGVQALLGVPGGAARVEHARDHPRDLEAAVGELRHDEVRVVAVGRGDEDVGLLDPGLGQRVELERRTDREAPAGLLPRSAELDVEPLVRERVLVEDGDDVAGAQRRRGDGGADAPGADDEDEHAVEDSSEQARRARRPPADARRGARAPPRGPAASGRRPPCRRAERSGSRDTSPSAARSASSPPRTSRAGPACRRAACRRGSRSAPRRRARSPRRRGAWPRARSPRRRAGRARWRSRPRRPRTPPPPPWRARAPRE